MPAVTSVIVAFAFAGALLTGAATGGDHARSYGRGSAAAAGPPRLGERVLVTPVQGVVRVRLRGARAFTVLHQGVELPTGSEIDTTQGTAAVTEAVDFAGATHVAEVSGGRAIVTQRRVLAAPTDFRLSQPLACGGSADATAARAAPTLRHRPRHRHIVISEGGGNWNTTGQYVATGAEGTKWTTADVCGSSTVSVQAGSVRVTNLITHTTVTLIAGQRLTVTAATTKPSFTCVGPVTLLFNNWNPGGVLGGGTPPTFGTHGRAYCLSSIATYHWNGGAGAKLGTIELTSSQGRIGPLKATGDVAGSPTSPDWIATLPSSSPPVILDGRYTCRDSDPSTWSQDPQSHGKGFCKVYVQSAIKG